MTFHRHSIPSALTVGFLAGALAAVTALGAPPSPPPDKDGWFDASEFLDKAYGFIPYAAPITEPAIGYGGTGGLLFVDKKNENFRPGFGRPNLTAVGGLGTENGTAGGYAFDSRHWMDDRLQTLAGAVYASINLDFYGIGEDSRLRDHPLRYNLNPTGGMLQTKWRIADSPAKVGIGYAFASTDVTVDAPASDPRRPSENQVSRVGSGSLSTLYDTRDNLFTPLSGGYYELSGTFCSPALGGDDTFQRAEPTLIQYVPLRPDLTLGILGSGAFAFGDIPFYMLPSISLRGVPVMRYQGEQAAQVETEVRWQFWKRLSLVVFGGAGAAWNNFAHVDNSVGVWSGGGGFRYELARSYGLHMGLDVAPSRDGPAIYIQLGSAWMRP